LPNENNSQYQWKPITHIRRSIDSKKILVPAAYTPVLKQSGVFKAPSLSAPNQTQNHSLFCLLSSEEEKDNNKIIPGKVYIKKRDKMGLEYVFRNSDDECCWGIISAPELGIKEIPEDLFSDHALFPTIQKILAGNHRIVDELVTVSKKRSS
jgi:hypothetical protein